MNKCFHVFWHKQSLVPVGMTKCDIKLHRFQLIWLKVVSIYSPIGGFCPTETTFPAISQVGGHGQWYKLVFLCFHWLASSQVNGFPLISLASVFSGAVLGGRGGTFEEIERQALRLISHMLTNSSVFPIKDRKFCWKLQTWRVHYVGDDIL
jgi:hypothetical protein